MTTAHITGISEHEARLISWEKVEETGALVLIRKWDFVDSTAVDTIIAALPSGTVTDPLADGNTYTGTWNIMSTEIVDEPRNGAGDRASAVIQTLSLTTADTLEIEYHVNCRYVEKKTFHFDLTQADMVALTDMNDVVYNEDVPPVITSTATTGETKDVQILRRSNNLFDVIITIRKRQSQTVAEYVSKLDIFEEEVTDQQLGVETSDIDETDYTLVNPDTVAGETMRRNISRNADCTNDVTMQVTTASEVGPTTTYREDLFEKRKRDSYRNKVTELSTDYEPPSGGIIKEYEKRLNEFSRYDIVQTTRTANPVTENEYTRGGDLEENKFRRYTNQSSEPTLNLPGTSAAGTITQVQARKNEFGLFDYTTVTREAKQRSDTKLTRGGDLETNDTQRFYNQAAQPTATDVGTSAAGEIKSVQSRRNEFGRFDYTVVTRTAVPRSDSELTRGGDLETNKAQRYYNQASEPTASSIGTAAAGEITAVQSRRNEFGRFDYSVITRTAVPRNDSELTRGGHLEETKTRAYYNQAAEPTASLVGTEAAGTITAVRSRRNEFGRFDYTTITRTAQARNETSVGLGGSELVDVGHDIYLNQVSAPSEAEGTAAAKTIKSVSNRMNEFGRFDYTITTRTAKKMLPSFFVLDDSNGQKAYRVGRNLTEAEVRSVLTDGNILSRKNSASVSINEYGLYDITIASSPSTSVGGGDVFGPSDYTRQKRQYKQNGEYYRDITYTISHRRTNSVQAAQAHADGGADGSTYYLGKDGTWDSYYVYPDSVTAKKISYGTWTAT